MPISTPSLKEFARAIPVCSQTCGLAEVLEIFHASGCDAIAVVTQQHWPLGVVKLPRMLPHLISSQHLGKTFRTRIAGDSNKLLSQLEPSIIEPLAILPAQLSLSQFWVYLQESKDRLTPDWEDWEDPKTVTGTQIKRGEWERNSYSAGKVEDIYPLLSSPTRHWALVDEEGKFLGMLDSWLLLKSVAQNLAATKVASVDKPPQSTPLQPLVQLLEQLPLPLSLQTSTGQVLAQNLCWRQQIGTLPNLDWVRRTTAAMLDFSSGEPCPSLNELSVPQGSPALAQHESKTPGKSPYPIPNVVKEQLRTSTGTATQRCCAIDTPRLATAVSTQQVISSAPLSGKSQEPLTVWGASLPASETLKKSQERVFSFVKIPLSSSVLGNAGEGEGENEQDASSSPYHSSISDLCVVLAQDTTEQQQVTKELAAKNADLIHLNRLKDEFLACISHELKTPLTAVLGLSTLLKDQALGELNERQARYARLIYQSGRQLMTLVNDILDLTRMETGQLELTLEPVQIQAVCDRAYSQARQLQHKEDQEEESIPEILFTLEIESGLETIVADELRLRQMLVNLLSNALKFTDVGGEIGLKVNRWDGWVAFTVRDTGIGIPPEKQHLIFQKFQQLEQPLTRRYEGTGLGLVLTQRLARLHGGDVSFISKADEGSQFTLLLPPCPPEGRRQGVHLGRLNAQRYNLQPSNPQATTEAKRNRLVLIVETVPRYLDSLTEQLNSLGYRVVIARAGTEAIEKARGLQPHAILLNPLLPQLSGWDVLTLLKSDAQTHHIPVLVTATQAEKEQAYDHKADGFLSLPVQKQALLQSLTCLAEQECPISKGLTILHLSPVERNPDTFTPLTTYSESSNFSAELTELLSLQHSELNYRVLEADDLEQAELLARVWHPNVVVLDSSKIADPLTYLEQFSSHADLAVLPLVTLDRQTTEAANQITGLSVYPCLALDSSSNMTALLQVIQIAVGMCRMPNILVMDIGEQGEVRTKESSRSHTLPSQRSRYKNTSLSSLNREETISTAAPHSGSKGKPSQNATTTPQSSWLQALIQYLQTAGFKTVLSCSWPEIYYQIQTQSVDLLLIRLKNIEDSSELEDGLIALAQLPNLPPVLMLDHRSDSMSEGEFVADNSSVQYPHRASQSDDIVMSRNASTASALDSLLKAVATQILHGHSLPMTQLLEQINQALEI